MAGRYKAGGRVGRWPGTAGSGGPWLRPLSGIAGPTAARLREWAASELAPGRLMPWLPVGFGLGIVVYFAAEREPVWWVAAVRAAPALPAPPRPRRHPIRFPGAVRCPPPA